jgi:hypothetical protein
MLLIFFFFLMLILPGSAMAQNLSFTVQQDTVFPNSNVTVINTSTNVPLGTHYRYSFINGTIRLSEFFGLDLGQYIFNGDTLEFSISPFDSTYNHEFFGIRLELLDSLYQIIQVDSFQVNMMMLSTLAPLPPRACHDPTPVNNQQWCNWNLICNGDFEWQSACPNGQDQLFLAEDWNGHSVEYYHACGQSPYTPTTSIFGVQAPRSGDGMAGFYGFLTTNHLLSSGSVEAINTILKEQLHQQQKYNLTFHVARGTAAPWPEPRFAVKIDALIRYSATQYSSTPLFFGAGLQAAWSSGSPTSTVNQQLIFSNGAANSGPVPYWEQHSIDFNPTVSSYAFLTIGLMTPNNIVDLTPGNPIKLGDFARYYLDDASLIPYPPIAIPQDGYLSLCNGPATLEVTGSENVKEYRWYDPNMQLIPGANGPVANISNAMLGTYTVEVENYHHCVNTYTCELLPSPTYMAQNYDYWHPEPVINGSPELCPSPDLQVYSVENPQPGVICTWSTVPSGFTITPLTTQRDQVTIDWSSVGFNGPVVVSVNAVYPTCTYTKSEFYVFGCCFNASDPGSFHNLYVTPGNVQLLNDGTKLHGIITVDGNVTINSKTLHMGPGAIIKVMENSTLTLNKCTLGLACDLMWNGIYVENTTRKVEVINNSLIGKALNAVFSSAGGAVLVSNSEISDCFIGIKVIDYRRLYAIDPIPQPIQFAMLGSNIKGDYQLHAPISGISKAGMYLKNVETIEIGSLANPSNTISESIFGIYGANIQAAIENNQFADINYHPNNTRLPNAAIYSVFYPRVNVAADAFKGDVIARHNQFNDCHVGIVSMKNQVYLHNNFFQDMGDEYCINVFDCRNPSRINQNVFSTGVKRGIYTARAAGAYSPGFEVNENNMVAAQNTLKYGIRLVNIKGLPLFPVSQPRIKANQIHFYDFPAPVTPHFGIYADHCHNSHFVCNEIKRVPSGGTNYETSWGIRISQTMGAQVYDNVIWKMGAGIYTSGDMYNTMFYCNDHVQSYLGYFFGPKTGLTNQGFAPGTSSTYPNGLNPRDFFLNMGQGSAYNGWRTQTNSGGSNIISPMISWYRYDTPIEYDPDIDNNSNLLGKISFITQNNASNVCTNPCTPMMTTEALDTLELTDEERDALYHEILQAREYDELMEEYRMYDEEYLYTLLASDTSILWLGGENDQEYRDFYDSVKASNVNRFYDIEKLIDSQVYEQAMDELIELDPLNTIEANLKTAYHIYLNIWALGRFELTQEEVNTLAEIALQLPYSGGRGVYTARIMLGIEPFENELAYRTSSPNTGKKAIVAYPNPAGQVVTFRFDEIPDKETAVIEIHSISGQVMGSIWVQPKETEHITDLSSFRNGIYVVRIKYASGDQASIKLVKHQ